MWTGRVAAFPSPAGVGSGRIVAPRGRRVAWQRLVGQLRTAIAILAFALTITVDPPMTGSPANQYSISGATTAEQELFVETHDRFVDAGLHLPEPIQVVFADGRESCDSHPAVYTYQKQTISFCRAPNQDWGNLSKLIVHELAHAWDDHNMTDATRRAYMTHLEFPDTATWLDPALPHDDRPGEMFARTLSGMVQGLIDRERLDELIGLRS